LWLKLYNLNIIFTHEFYDSTPHISSSLVQLQILSYSTIKSIPWINHLLCLQLTNIELQLLTTPPKIWKVVIPWQNHSS
jgi:hypothetical protein